MLAVAVALAGTAAAWFLTTRAIARQQAELEQRIAFRAVNQAMTISSQIARQILTIDQALRALTLIMAGGSGQTAVDAWRDQTVTTNGISRDLLVVDALGIVRQASIPEVIGQDVSDSDYYRALSAVTGPDQVLFLGQTTIDPIFRLWHIDVARVLRRPDGAFDGLLVTDYRVDALAEVLNLSDVGSNGLVALIGLGDGLIRAAVGPQLVDPDASQQDSVMFRALRANPVALWRGPSSLDAVDRLHAFQEIGGRGLAVIVGIDERRTLATNAHGWLLLRLLAGGVSLLALIILGFVMHVRRQERRHAAALAAGAVELATMTAVKEAAEAADAARASQLHGVLAGVADAVVVIDGHGCLSDWNERFAEIAGVPADLLRVGTPVERLLAHRGRRGTGGTAAGAGRAQDGWGVSVFAGGRDMRQVPLADGGVVAVYRMAR